MPPRDGLLSVLLSCAPSELTATWISIQIPLFFCLIFVLCCRVFLFWFLSDEHQKVAEHHRKQRKEAKKNPTTGRKIKDPGIPNSLPFKEEVCLLRACTHMCLRSHARGRALSGLGATARPMCSCRGWCVHRTLSPLFSCCVLCSTWRCPHMFGGFSGGSSLRLCLEKHLRDQGWARNISTPPPTSEF